MNSIKPPLLKILNKTYEPLTLVEMKFLRHDLAFRTDAEGRPILVFMGTKTPDGTIRGERYARRLVVDAEGKIVKDHWDHKGKAS